MVETGPNVTPEESSFQVVKEAMERNFVKCVRPTLDLIKAKRFKRIREAEKRFKQPRG